MESGDTVETFNEYWSLLPIKDTDVYFELQNYLTNPGGCETDLTRIFKISTHKFLLTNIIEFPYPMCQIVRCFPPLISGQILYDTLLNYVESPITWMIERKESLFSLLVNVCVTDKWLQKCESHVFPILFNRFDDVNDFGEFPLVLLANTSMPLVRIFINYENDKNALNPFSSKSAFSMVVDKKIHFFEHVFFEELANKLPGNIADVVQLVKTAITISNGVKKTKENFELIHGQFVRNIDPLKLSANHSIVYNEIRRIFALYQFMRSNQRFDYQMNSMAIRTFSTKYNILDYLFQFDEGSVIAMTAGYHVVRNLLNENQRYNEQIEADVSKMCSKSSEVDVYDQFYAVQMLAEILLVSSYAKNYEEIVRAKCVEVKAVIDNIENTLSFVEAVESLFTMLFLRWEHVNGTIGSGNKLDHFPSLTTMDESDTSIEYNDNDVTAKKMQQTQTSVKSGFVCSFIVLQNVLNILSSSLTNHKIKENDKNELHNIRFMRIFKEIVDAKWRLSLIDDRDVSAFRAQISKNLKQLLIPCYDLIHTQTFSSSDEEEDERSNGGPSVKRKIMRRKPRRKHSNRIFNEHEASKPIVCCKEIDNKSTKFKENVSISRSGGGRDRRGVISKMLGTPIDLVAICMTRDNLKEARSIIQAHNLGNATLAQEICFIENVNELKLQLKDYLKATPSCSSETKMDSDYSVEEIKNLVVHGFESSQILNLLETFIAKNPVVQSRDTKSLLKRFSSNYPYLELYTGTALQGTSVADYLLSLSTNSDICFNIFNMLPKLWDKSDRIDAMENQLGYYGCFKHIISTLSRYNAARNQSFGFQYLLSNQCYLFNDIEMALKLKQEDAFEKLKQIDMRSLATIPGLKENIMQFEVFNKKDGNLLSYVFYHSINMNRLTNFKDLNIKEINSTSLQQILEIDLFSLVGEIIFDNSSTPVSLTDIEAVVCNLNTNLLHVITVNTCPVISICSKIVPNPTKELADIRHLLEQDVKAQSMNLLQSQSCPPRRKHFEIKNADLLDYIRQHNELIAYLLGEIHGVQWQKKTDDHPIQVNCSILENLLKMEELTIRTASTERQNGMVSALSFDYFDLAVVKELIRNGDYRSAVRIFQYCQESHHKQYETQIHQIQDVLITKILEQQLADAYSPKNYEIIEFVGDLRLKANILLEQIERINDHELALRLIRTILLHSCVADLNEELFDNLKKYLSLITLYASISKVLTSNAPEESWTKVMQISQSAPETLLNCLIEQNQYDLCYQWIQIHPLQVESLIKPKFTELLINRIAESRLSKNEHFDKVCKSLLKIMVAQMDSNLLLQLRNHKLLQYLIDSLIEQSPHENQVYKNYKIALRIFEVIDEVEAKDLWHLVQDPLLVVEQYILNTKFETLNTILKAIRPLIKNNRCKICLDSQPENAFPSSEGSGPMYKQILGDNSLKSSYVNYKNHCTSVDCVDHLLRIYAAKALDFRISEIVNGQEYASQSNETASLDSLCGTYIMPHEAPDKSNWVRDEEATHCMCCKRSVFTMLTRRHHCRRCGRVVCHSCSTKRQNIPKLYADVLVRACDDCFRQTNEANSPIKLVKIDDIHPADSSSSLTPISQTNQENSQDWGWVFRFSGHIKHDNLLREEFSFEYAPSASLCLSILAMHTPGPVCGNFLLSFCQKFETLLRPIQPGHPNPEVDYTFVTRILYCLSLAAKVYGGSPDCGKIREHAEIINSVVRNGCESMLPMESINTASLRALRDSLVVAEKWSFATELSLKCGFPKTGIMAAWGVAALKSGCFETAREKFVHCLTRTSPDEDHHQIVELLTLDESSVKSLKKTFSFKSTARPSKIQPLLQEILSILEATCHPLHTEAVQKATIISQSNRSLASIKSRKKENIPMHEPAVNILHTLSNLRQITQGKYTVKTHKTIGIPGAVPEHSNSHFPSDAEQFKPNSRFYTESMFYLISYGRHADILRFLIKYKQIVKALKYTVLLHIPCEEFIQTIILPHLRTGRLSAIVEHMIQMDETLMTWKDYIIKTCVLLEKKKLYNSLYQMQLLLKDTVRASMTCVKFYTMGMSTYQELRYNAFHLMNAQKHLKSELELCQWEEIKAHSRKTDENLSLVMKMDSKSLNQHINTIWRQIDASKFLAKCEENGKETVNIIPKISLLPCTRIPTLFGTAQDKIILTALILICGTNIEEGFGLSYRIIQDMTLNADKIYAIVTKYVALNNRLHDVEKLIDCIKSNSNQPDYQLCDEILSLAVQTAFSAQGGQQQIKSAIENLIRMIDDIGTQINCHILSGQLKAAYLLAVQHKRVVDIRRILRHADKTNQLQIKKLCEKKLLSIDAHE